MAQSKAAQIEKKRPVRYTAEVVDGNTVRVQEVPSPQRAENEERRIRINEARERALRVNLRYVVFLTAAAALTVVICIFYLKLQAVSTQLQKKTVSLQTQLDNLQIENDTVYSEIVSGVDLEKVRETAIDTLGMTYPSQDQIVTYDAASSDYVKQYEEIPD